MALVTNPSLRKRLEIPHEPGEWVEIRPLSGKRLDEARRARMLDRAEVIRQMGGDVYRTLQEIRRTELAEAAALAPAGQNGHAARLDPDEFDAHTVLRGGLVAWSYGEYQIGQLDQLDSRTMAWLVGQILEQHQPTTEEERKNA